MKLSYTLYAVLLVLLLTACGRQLPDQETIDSATLAPSRVPTTQTDVTAVPDDTAVDSAAAAEETAEPAEAEAVAVEPTVPTDPVSRLVSIANPQNGETLFNQMTNTGFACSNCHDPNTTQTLVGPGLYGIPQRAAERVEGQSAAQYIHNSIIHPNDYIVDSFASGLMPATYEEIFTESEIYDITAYLMTFEDPSLVAQAPADTGDASEPTTEATDEAAEATEAVEVAEATEPAAGPVDGESVVQVVTSTPVVIVVTATPSPPAVPESVSDLPDATPTINPEGTPDIVVTLSNLGIRAYGEELYNAELAGGFACSDCHLVDSTEMLVGSSMLNIGTRAAFAVPGQPAERTIYNAIMEPEVHSLISENYADVLTTSQVYDLVAYLMSLHE